MHTCNTDRYVGPPYCRAEMYAGRVACCPMVSHVSISTRQTDGWTPDRYITLSAMDAVSAIIYKLMLRLTHLPL